MSHNAGLTIKVDGKTRRLSRNTHSSAPGWITVFLMGFDLKGRECQVSALDLPEWFFYRGGKIRTGGQSIELKRDGGYF